MTFAQLGHWLPQTINAKHPYRAWSKNNWKPSRDGRRYVACDLEPAPISPAPIDTLYVKTSLFTASLFTFENFIKCSFSSQR